MKKWGLLVSLFYVLVLIALTTPITLLCRGADKHLFVTDTYLAWGYWVVLAVMGIGQLLLLFVPIQSAERRPKSRRSLLVPVITAAFMFMLLLSAVILCLMQVIWGDNNFTYRSGSMAQRVFGNGYTWIGMALLIWLFWTAVFSRFSRNAEPDALIRRLVSWLLKGSILELLVAVPCHIIVRRRGDCCAPVITFWGIAAGIAIMLLSFGPGVFFLFVERCRRKQQAKTPSGTK